MDNIVLSIALLIAFLIAFFVIIKLQDKLKKSYSENNTLFLENYKLQTSLNETKNKLQVEELIKFYFDRIVFSFKYYNQNIRDDFSRNQNKILFNEDYFKEQTELWCLLRQFSYNAYKPFHFHLSVHHFNKLNMDFVNSTFDYIRDYSKEEKIEIYFYLILSEMLLYRDYDVFIKQLNFESPENFIKFWREDYERFRSCCCK